MAQFIPKRDETLEADKHQKWLEGKALAHEKEIAALRAALDKLLAANASGGKQTAVVNAAVRDLRDRVSGTNGVPNGGREDDRLGKLSDIDGEYDWVRNTLGGAELAYFYLAATGDFVDLLDDYESKYFEVNIDSPAPGEPFSIRFPEALHIADDVGTALYIFSLNVYGNSAEVILQGDVPTYHDRPGTFIMGAPVVAGEGSVTLPAGFSGQWFVLGNPSNGQLRAIPLVDGYHVDTFGTPVTVTATTPTVVATAAAGTGAAVTVTGTSTAGVVQLVTGTSPTTTGWGELLTFTSGWASGDVPVLALHPANQNAAALKHYATRAGTEAEALFDLTGIVASTTYLFHYSLLPFAA